MGLVLLLLLCKIVRQVYFNENIIDCQDTSDDGDGECVVDAMVSEDEDQMSIVDNEDHLVKDDIAMDIVDTPIIPDPHEQLNEKVYLVTREGGLMLESTA